MNKDKIVDDLIEETFDKLYEIIIENSKSPEEKELLQASLNLISTLEDGDRIKSKAKSLSQIFGQIAEMEE